MKSTRQKDEYKTTKNTKTNNKNNKFLLNIYWKISGKREKEKLLEEGDAEAEEE